MELIRSFDKDKNKTKDLFQDIHPSEKIIIPISKFVRVYPTGLFQNRNELLQKYAFHDEAFLELIQNNGELFLLNEMQNINILLERQ